MEEKTRHILIVDDSNVIGKILKRKIESILELPVIVATSLQETIDVLHRNDIYISEAVLDFNLPDAPYFFRKMISGLLSVQQFQVLIAKDGIEGLNLLKEHPDTKRVITDYAMPNMNGDDLCKKIRQEFSREDLAIIGISSKKNDKMAAQFIKSGANDFIIKHFFIIEEFYCRVFHCIENINLIRQVREAASKDRGYNGLFQQ